jgi:hypothetical protein
MEHQDEYKEWQKEVEKTGEYDKWLIEQLLKQQGETK